jgi:bifunctional non-homologous end joining protein LigD
MSTAQRATRSRQRAAPALEPQLASLVSEVPVGSGWVFETKYDGYRIVARVEPDSVTLSTRNAKDFTARAPRVADALRKLGHVAVLDGELVSPPTAPSKARAAVAGDFQALQNALRAGRSAKLVYFVFDLLHLDGVDLRPRPLRERKQALRALLAQIRDPHVRLGEHLEGQGSVIFQHACRVGMEGVIAKRADAPYVAGRTRSWLKIKCMGREELLVVGYTKPGGSRTHLGALLLATRERGKLRYAGKVGTGFTRSSLLELSKRLRPLRRATPPVSAVPGGAELRDAVWVEPQLVVEVAFTEWTQDGRLRHPSFQGLREDKAASEVRRERKLAASAVSRPG